MKLPIIGGVAMNTVTCAVPEPPLFVHVSVYVVFAVSVTMRCWPLITVPSPLSIVQVGAGAGVFEYVHAKATAVATPDGT